MSLTLKEIEELEKGLVCLVPKRESVNEFTSLLTSHEYTNNMCDCTKLKLLKMARELLELKEKSETVKVENRKSGKRL